MKKFLALFTFLTLFVFSACGSEQSSTVKEVRIGTLDLVNSDLIAQHEKWYENELGVPVKLIKFDSGKDMNAAIAAGGIDIGQEGTSPAALAIANNLDVEVIWIGDIIGKAETLVAKNGSGINSLQDLVGKKVATPFSSTAHYSLLNALKLEGINENDVQILDLEPDDIFATWQRGDIDAAYVWFPVLGRLLEDGTSITDSEQLAQRGILTGDLNVVRSAYAKENPEVVQKFVQLQLRGNEIIASNKPAAVDAVSAVLNISKEDADEQLNEFKYLNADEQIEYLDNQIAQTLKNTADFLVEQKSIKSAPTIEEFKQRVTSEFVKSARS